MTKFQFNSVFRKTLGLVGAGDAHYRAHSFRIGATTSASAMGVHPDRIRAMGRWRSDAVHSYIRPDAVCCFMGGHKSPLTN